MHFDKKDKQAETREKTTIILVIGLIVSIIMMGIGFLLWTNLTPIQDIESYSPQELRDIQENMAINFPLGSILLNIGFVGFSTTLLALVLKRIMSLIKKKQ
ncbi:MAG: hypothetical protein U5K84_06060 [Alkalibacterium sp.]|nr:hypothetical protein [Alkalibacterium sp.]